MWEIWESSKKVEITILYIDDTGRDVLYYNIFHLTIPMSSAWSAENIVRIAFISILLR